MKEFLISTFPNFTVEMYEGNAPCGTGGKMVDGGDSDRWTTQWGGGLTYKDEFIHASFSLNHKITIHIVGNHLWIVDIRHDGKPDFWEYTNIEGRGMPGYPCCSEKSRHELEPERIEKILNTKIENCKFWDLVQTRAKELYSQGVIKIKGE